MAGVKKSVQGLVAPITWPGRALVAGAPGPMYESMEDALQVLQIVHVVVGSIRLDEEFQRVAQELLLRVG